MRNARADLWSAVALEQLEEDCCAQAKGEAHHQAGTKDIQKLGKDVEHCGPCQLYITA